MKIGLLASNFGATRTAGSGTVVAENCKALSFGIQNPEVVRPLHFHLRQTDKSPAKVSHYCQSLRVDHQHEVRTLDKGLPKSWERVARIGKPSEVLVCFIRSKLNPIKKLKVNSIVIFLAFHSA